MTILEIMKDLDICFVAKLKIPKTNLDDEKVYVNSLRAQISFLRNNACKIISIQSDNVAYLETPLGDFHKQLLRIAYKNIYPSRKLMSNCSDWFVNKSDQLVIEDPTLLRLQKSRPLKTNEVIKLIWFGHGSNLRFILSELENIIEKSDRAKTYLLSFLTSIEILDDITPYLRSLQKQFTNWNFKLIQWDHFNQPSQLEKELSKVHISLIPSDYNDPLKNGASHNRILDSIRSGCITLSNLDSYTKFKSIACLSNSFPRDLKYIIKHYDQFAYIVDKSNGEMTNDFLLPSITLQWGKSYSRN